MYSSGDVVTGVSAEASATESLSVKSGGARATEHLCVCCRLDLTYERDLQSWSKKMRIGSYHCHVIVQLRLAWASLMEICHPY